MSLLDMTAREMSRALALWPGRRWRLLRYRVRRALNPPAAAPPPARAVRSRFVGLGRDGSDLWMDTELPGSMVFPIMSFARGSFSTDQDTLPAPPTFGARVFHLYRIVRADHLGPTEAEYRETTDSWRSHAL